MTEFRHAPMHCVYRVKPDDPTEVQVKHNKPRARWRHHSRHGSAAQAQSAMWRLVFAEQDKEPR